MRNDQARHVAPTSKEARPQLGFGVGVEGRREIVENEQLGVAQEHARRGSALDLAAGELHSAWADQRVEAMLERQHIGLQDSGMDRGVERGRIVWPAEQQVVAERRAEQTRHLRGIGAAWRDKERPRILDEQAIPADLALIVWQQTKKDLQ